MHAINTFVMRAEDNVPARLNFAFIAPQARTANIVWGNEAELLLYKSARKAICSKVSGQMMASSDGGMAEPDRKCARLKTSQNSN